MVCKKTYQTQDDTIRAAEYDTTIQDLIEIIEDLDNRLNEATELLEAHDIDSSYI